MIAKIEKKIKANSQTIAYYEDKIAKEQSKNKKDIDRISISFWKGAICALKLSNNDLKELLEEESKLDL